MKIQRNKTSLIGAVLVMGLSLINTVIAESTSEEYYGRFINNSKSIYYNSLCDADGRLSCIKGSAINFDNKCQAKVIPFVDSCLNSYKSELKEFAVRIERKDYLANFELPVFLKNTITPCIEGGISVAQGNEHSFVSQCFNQKLENRIALKTKQKLIDNILSLIHISEPTRPY